MQYYITIQDVDNLEDELIIHFSGKDDVVLTWEGGDDKTQAIIGSQLSFSLLVDDCEEGKYDKYFTTNEQKWRVELRIDNEGEANDDIIWRGFLLPESYSEPYANNTFLVNFSAVDGLGLLKGKDLPDKYYEEELRVTDFITKALEMTGIDFDLLLAPAIVNSNVPFWGAIIFDGRHFVNDQGERSSAYEILEYIVYSMRCQLFQDPKGSKGWWRMEGLNKRQLIRNEYRIFPMGNNGIPLDYTTFDKNVKQLDWVAYPSIDLVPPFKKVVATHDKEDLELPERLYQLGETDFNLNKNSVQNYFIPEAWQYDTDYFPLFLYDKENLFFRNEAQNPVFDESRKFELRHKPYILEGQQIKISLAFKISFFPGDYKPTEAELEDFVNAVVYRVSLNNNILFYNHEAPPFSNQTLNFNTSGEAEVELFYTATESGSLNIELFEPFGDVTATHKGGAYLTDLSLEAISETENDFYTATIDENASKTQELELPISQDVTGLTPNFQLDYLRATQPGSGGIIVGFIHRIFEDHGIKYYSVSIQTAKLIEQFPDSVYYRYGTTFDNYKFNNPKVIYNYEGGDEFVVTGIQEFPADTPQQFAVFTRKTREPQIPQNQWMEWSNSFYGIEKKPYLQVVAELEKELYEVPFLQMEGDAKNPVKINDMIRFRYKGEWRYLMVSNCEWNIGDNTSKLLLQEAMYNGNSIGLIPPFVFAGEDKTVQNPGNVISNADATAIAINGTIETYLWEQTAGTPATIEEPNQLFPMIHNITGTGNVFKLTVTDSNGNTASDTMEINTQINHELVFDVIQHINDTGGTGLRKEYWLIQIDFDPVLGDDEMVNLYYEVEMEMDAIHYSFFSNEFYVRIVKNGIEVYKEMLFPNAEGSDENWTENKKNVSFKGVLTCFKECDINFELMASEDFVAVSQFNHAQTKITFTHAESVNGHYTKITNLPKGETSFLP